MKKKYYLLIGLLLICMLSRAQSYQIYAYYMYSFSKQITWPNQEGEEYFKIGIVGESQITVHLEKMASLKKVNNKIIKVITFDNVDAIQDCNILFLPMDQSNDLSKALNAVGNRSILLVTEKNGLAAQGSAINFVMKNKRLMFEMNDEAINKANLQVASELKKYAIQL